MTGAVQEWVDAVRSRVSEVVFGMEDAVDAVAFSRLARGHVLLEGVPGIGKTLLARTLAASFGGDFARVQCTSDLMPSDVIGTTVYEAESARFAFRPGPVFTDLLLVDEINRTGPRTQSALLEAMEERAVSVDGERHALPEGFTLLATQNPVEFEGTYPLPESQIDRFLARVLVSYPEPAFEHRVLSAYADTRGRVTPTLTGPVPPELEGRAREEVDDTRIEAPLVDYVVALATASREHDALALGLSTRGARALLVMARIAARAQGSDFVRPDDVKRVAPWVVPHRLVLTADAQLEGRTGTDLLDDLLTHTPVPR